MAGFGGAVKLTGESEYRNALKKITQNLKEVSSEMKLVASQYDKNDRSEAALTAKTEVYNKQLAEQNNKLDALNGRLKDVEKYYKEQSAELADLNKQYDTEKNKLEGIEATLGKTSQEYKDQSKVVKDLGDKVAGAAAEQDKSEKEMSDLRIEINKTQTAANKTAKEIEGLGKDTATAGEEAKKSTEGFTIFKGVVADLASSAIKKAVEGLKELGQKFIEVGKLSLSSYSTYEQTVGGVETLFKDSAKTVEKFANEAYKTAGVSANEYMQQVTSFSATLLQGLNGDTAKAAEYADKAIRDMSDNANKMGTDLSTIQTAYQAIARQTYTTLDNLRIGYGGSAAEMARLVNDSGVLGESVKVTANTVKDIPFSTIIDAIHKVQENLGITGTTAKEASDTIEGSGKAIKASWENLLVGIADGNKNTKQLTNTLVDNIKTYLKNVIPVVKNIAQNLVKTVMSVLREFAPGVANVLEGVVSVVKGLFDFISKNWRPIVAALSAIAAGFAAFKIASVITSVVTAIKSFASALSLGQSALSAFSAVAAANPFVLLATGIAAAVTALVVFSASAEKSSVITDKFRRAQEELNAEIETVTDSMSSANDAYSELKDEQQNLINSKESEFAYYQQLWTELQSIVDENGKVKEGYEARASFITDQLSKATDLEIGMIDGQIQGYQNLQSEMDRYLTKKKYQIILDSQEALYKDAWTNRDAALRDYNKSLELYRQKQSQIAELQKKDIAAQDTIRQYEKEAEQYRKHEISQMTVSIGQYFAALGAHEELTAALAEEGAVRNELADQMDATQKRIREYNYNIGVYEKNAAMFHQEQYEDMITVTGEYVAEYGDAADAERAILEAQVEDLKYNLATMKKDRDAYNTDIYDAQIKAAEDQLAALQNQLDGYRDVTEKGLKDSFDEWVKSLDETGKLLADSEVDFEYYGDGTVQAFVNGEKKGERLPADEMKKVVEDALEEANKTSKNADEVGKNFVINLKDGIANNASVVQEEAKKIGWWTGEGFKNGLNSTAASVQSAAVSIANGVTGAFKSFFDMHSPSKLTRQLGEYVGEGFALGIEDSAREAAYAARQLSDGTMNALAVNTSKNGVSAADVSMVDAFKEALSEMKIELDDHVAGKFVERTVAAAIY